MPTPVHRTFGQSPHRLAALHWDHPRTPTVVCLPGAGGNAALFADFADGLGQDVIGVDPHGIGASDDADGHDLVIAADRIAEAVHQAVPGPKVWVGHSWGGKVAALIGARRPETADALVLIDPSPASALDLDDANLEAFARSIWDGQDGPWPSRDAAIDGLRSKPHYEKWTPNLERALHRDLTETSPGRWTVRTTLDSLLAVCDATLRVDHSDTIAGLRQPTLYLVASDSVWWQEISNDRMLPGHVERIVVEGGHHLYLDATDEVAEHVRRFLTALR